MSPLGGWHCPRSQRSEALQHMGGALASGNGLCDSSVGAYDPHGRSLTAQRADPHQRSPHDSEFRRQLEAKEKADWRHKLAELEKADQQTMIDLIRYDRPKGSHPVPEVWNTQRWRMAN